MVKTQIQIEDWQYAALKKESAVTDRSMSDYVREALTLALGRKAPAQPLSEIAGKYVPGSLGDLKSHDAAWADTIR